MRTQCWRLSVAIGLGMSGAIATTLPSTLAQVVADPSLGTTAIPIAPNYVIIGGTTVGSRNLFHSFSRFDVPNGAIAAFFNDPTITNILARVTGGTRSNIDGTILTQGTTNLFLINPSGILFGPGAQLNIGGSFIATTANAIQFPGGAAFSLTSSVDPPNPLLAVNPSAFLFSQIAAQSITNQSTTGLQTVGGSVLLLGGDVISDGGNLLALGGELALGGLAAPGLVRLNDNNNRLSLSFPEDVTRANVLLTNQSLRGTDAEGNITIHAQNVELSNISRILTVVTSPDSQAGKIQVDATGAVRLSDSSQIASGILSGGSSSGSISVYGRTVDILNGSQIGAASFGQGNTGTLAIRAIDIITLSGRNAQGAASGILSSIGSVLGFSSNGNGGDINLQARTIALKDGSAVVTGNLFAQGNAGNIQIDVSDALLTLLSVV